MQFSAFLKVFIIISIFLATIVPTVAQSTNDKANNSDNQDKLAASITLGSNSGLPIPRFVSLKSNKVNVRVGPDQEKYRIVWVYQKAGLPVEIIAEYDQWRRIRDANGDQGWVNGALLDGQRTVMVAPWNEDNKLLIMRKTSDDDGVLVAQVQSGVIGTVRSCNGTWCELNIKGFRGWLKQIDLWGVYPNEIIKK